MECVYFAWDCLPMARHEVWFTHDGCGFGAGDGTLLLWRGRSMGLATAHCCLYYRTSWCPSFGTGLGFSTMTSGGADGWLPLSL